METIRIHVYTRAELIECCDKAQAVIKELGGKKLTSFGRHRLDHAMRTEEEIAQWLKWDLDVFMVRDGKLVSVTISEIEQ